MATNFMMIFLMKMYRTLKIMYLKVSENDDIIGELSEVIDRLLSSEWDDVNTVLTKDGTRWARNKPSVRRCPARNNLVKKLRLTGYSENIRTSTEAFELFVSDDILDVIIQETNRRAVALKEDIGGGELY
ncbi:hypothetical protein QE152_g5250 [Popillia japonica]|uniref:Uncharacterized protein n=1 Tax=Popillia japonica TaxID=7064 RepID=A0AAW1MRY2_POPJA